MTDLTTAEGTSEMCRSDVQVWHLVTWFSGGLGSIRFTVGLDNLQGLFQIKRFYDSK